jgi:hypothetical protein
MYQIAILDVVNTQLPTIRDESGVWISLRELSKGMGLAENGQISRLKSDSHYTLSEKVFKTNGGEQKKICISMNQLPAYLYSINPNKVKASSKELVLKFQEVTFEVINSYWLGDLNTPQIKELQEVILKQNALVAATTDTISQEQNRHKNLVKLYEKTLNENETLKSKMKQQLSLIVTNVSNEILTRFEESLDVTARGIELRTKDKQ